MIGTTISHYKILEKLGGGGMGVVYKAQDTRLMRTVALKFLPPDLTRDEESKTRFVHEAQATSALQHNNICNIHDIEETEDGQTFIVMDCYEGGTLKSRLAKGELRIEDAIDIAIQVAQGLSEAHAHGIVHRDIKPANIMVTTRGDVKVLDFGLAKLAGQTMLTKSGSTIGTAAYMSPEQARGEKVDHRTDIWSLGVVLYEMLAGKRPFESEYEQGLVFSILNQNPKPIRELRPEMPEELEKICRRAISKEAKDRYQTAAELILDLESYSAGTQLSLKTRKVVGKKLRLLYAVLATLATVIVGIFYFTGKGQVFDRVAVLPFHNLSKDSTQEYLADGMTEEVITRLQHVASLNVPSIRGTMKFKGSQASYADIARELSAKALVEASILLVNNRVRVIAKLIDPAKDRALWSETYDASVEDILDLQSKIAQALVKVVRVEVTRDEVARLGRTRRVDPRAYQLYMKARQRFYINTVSEGEYEEALMFLEQAIAIDSSCLAFHSLAAVMYQDAAHRGLRKPEETLPRMQKAVQIALSLDDQNSESQKALALLDRAKWDWKGAETAFLRALEISPGDAEIRHSYSWLLLLCGRSQEAIAQMNRAYEIDPSLDTAGSWRVSTYVMAERFDDAIRVATDFLKRFPNDAYLHNFLACAYAPKGMCDSAAVHLERSLELAPSIGDILIELNCAWMYQLCGQHQKAQGFLDHYLAVRKGKTVESYWVAATYAILGDTSKAYSWLERAYREKSGSLENLKIDIPWDSQQSNPRYRDMLRRIGLDK